MRIVHKSVIRKQEKNEKEKIWIDRKTSKELIKEELKMHEKGSSIIKPKEGF